MSKINKSILGIGITVLVFSLFWDIYVHNSVENKINTIQVNAIIEQKEKELIFNINPNKQLPKFSSNYIKVLTSEFEKVDLTALRNINDEIYFIERDQDIFLFKINDEDKELFQITFQLLEGEKDFNSDDFSIAIESKPYSLWSRNSYLTETFLTKISEQ
ncbi:hypothetical protein M3172_13435 [Mesobacillus subterraneus]|uniref:hypothetical protein n=1 Tax=Mesobacillus subterraneus TaxID=285983 RepID=UPI00203E3601|nr:hypothetical protein [Mesobacillus subterraneus]MCM3574192.1 hypothetical protein [Mesobacillus subterraneus]